MGLGVLIYNKVNNLIKHSRWYNETLFGGCRKFWAFNSYDIDVVNLGSSASLCAFDYTGIELKCCNWALPSQYLLADYEILKNYSTFLKKGSTVILGSCLFSLDGYDVTYFDDRYYTFLYPSSIWQYSSHRMNKVIDMKNHPIKYYPLLSFLISLKHFFRTPKEKGLSGSQFKKNAKNWMLDIWSTQFGIDNLEEPLTLRNNDLLNQAIKIVSKIKDFCDVKGYNFVIVIPPVSQELKEWLTPQMLKNYVYPFRDAEELQGIKYFDYLDNPLFNNNNLFKNAYLMNAKGARLFTEKVLSDLHII